MTCRRILRHGANRWTSPANARGLMQVTEITVKELAKYDSKKFGHLVTVENGKEKVNMAALDDAKLGIEAGTAALKMYMDRYDGDAEKALMAYNWGPDNAKRANFDINKAPAETQWYVEDIRKILKDTQGFELPKASLLHYLPSADTLRYR